MDDLDKIRRTVADAEWDTVLAVLMLMPGFTPPTVDRSADRGIWGPGK